MSFLFDIQPVGLITHDRVLGVSVGISVNIPTKTFCPPMCFLFIFHEVKVICVYVWSYIDWVGWVEINLNTWRRWAGLAYKALLALLAHFHNRCKIWHCPLGRWLGHGTGFQHPASKNYLFYRFLSKDLYVTNESPGFSHY